MFYGTELTEDLEKGNWVFSVILLPELRNAFFIVTVISQVSFNT